MLKEIPRNDYLGFRVCSTSNYMSILEAAILLYDWLVILMQYDPLFGEPYLNRKNDILIDLTHHKRDITIHLIAEHILRETKHEIEFYEKEKNPDYNYVYRQRGYVMLLTFKNKDKIVAMGKASLGSPRYGFLSIDNIKEKSYEWYFNFQEYLIEKLNAKFASISVLRSLDEYYGTINLKFGLTYISFFSNEFEHKIPDDIEGVEYIFTEKGKYMITTREDFLKDKESFLHHKDKIMRIGRELKERVPELSW